jgi:hypothetical protein
MEDMDLIRLLGDLFGTDYWRGVVEAFQLYEQSAISRLRDERDSEKKLQHVAQIQILEELRNLFRSYANLAEIKKDIWQC